LIAFTRGGARLAARVAAVLPEATVYVAPRWLAEAGPRAQPLADAPAPAVARLFAAHGGLVFFTAVGVAVRLVAPLLRGKTTDPGVVAVDEAGRYAVSVLAGHLGGGNALAERVAGALGARAVITTASEARGTLAVDLLGQEYGWRLEHLAVAKGVSAALVNGEVVGFVQEAGETVWQRAPEAAGLQPFADLDALAAAGCPGLVITDRRLPARHAAAATRWVVFRPRSLVLGVGASSGVTAAEIEALARAAFEEAGLVWASLAVVATLGRKAQEPGVAAFAARHGLPIRGFPASVLAAVPVPTPSTQVAAHVGTPSVCEAAALLAAGGPLVVPKRKGARATVAIARRTYPADEA
jgi:cobalt-precorrin 5A hydrolase